MYEPQGPLPPEIYRRRRFAAVGLGLLVIIIVVSVIAVSCSGGSDDASAAAQASSARAVSTQAADADGAAGGASGSPTPTSSASPSRSTTTSASPSVTTDSGAAAAGGGEAGSREPQEPGGQCADSSISVTVEPEKPGYQVGDSVTFITTVANIADVPCVRDLSGPKIVDTVATVGGDEVWSNADCFPGTGSDIRTLAPGEKAHFKMVWAGTSSKQGCEPAQRDPVEAGVYAVTAHVGEKSSDPVPFNVR